MKKRFAVMIIAVLLLAALSAHAFGNSWREVYDLGGGL